MGDHTRPLTAFDWTISIPLIFRHPGAIPAGRKSDLLVANYDLLPTILQYLGLGDRLPEKPPLPGRNFAPLLAGESVPWDNTVFYEFENVRAIRTRDWKYVERIHQEPNELYDLINDPGELGNLNDRPEHEDVREELRQRLHEFFDRYAEPQWDLWKGGKAKTDLITEKFFGIKNPYQESRYGPGMGAGRELAEQGK
jgi:arylsulfatase A-like enzyme